MFAAWNMGRSMIMSCSTTSKGVRCEVIRAIMLGDSLCLLHGPESWYTIMIVLRTPYRSSILLFYSIHTLFALFSLFSLTCNILFHRTTTH